MCEGVELAALALSLMDVLLRAMLVGVLIGMEREPECASTGWRRWARAR